MSARDPLAALQKLAALRAQRALAALAAARARETAEAERLAATVSAAAETFPVGPDPEPGTLAFLWRRRMVLEAQGDAVAARLADRRAEAGAARAEAGEAVARELGAVALARRAAQERARADARRHERSMGVLAALRGPTGP